MLLLTDLLTRSPLTPARQRTALARSGAVLHIGVVEGGSPRLEVRDDPWSPVARATGGLVWDAAASSESKDQLQMGKVFEEWARPVRLHALQVVAPALAGEEHHPPDTLAEGAETTFAGITRAAVSPVQVRGELWSRPVRLTVRPDPAETRLWSALVFGTSLRDELSEPEMMVLARHGRAVSPVTSYLAIEPGVRPSTEGLDELEGTGYGAGGAGSRVAGLLRHYSPDHFDHLAYLKSAVIDAWRTCAGTGAVGVELETTLVEIVDVTVRAAEQRQAASCLQEALWQLELPEPFRATWQRWSVEL